MLIVNGTINGTLYEEKQVPAGVLMDAFKIPPFVNDAPKTFRLKSGTGHMRKDRSNPGMLVTPGARVDPQFTVNTKDGSLSIRFAQSRTIIPGTNGAYRYVPKKVEMINGRQQFFFGPNQSEEYVWFYLHPRNASSPFVRQPWYEHFDVSADATKQMEQMTAQIEMTTTILNMPEHELRLRAAGLSYMVGTKRRSMPNAVSMPIAVLRSKLVAELQAAQGQFIDAWKSSDTSVVGICRVAESLKIVKKYPLNGGNSEWRFAEEYGGARIVIVNKGQDPLSILVGEVTSNYQTYVGKLKNLIDLVQDPNAPEIPQGKLVEGPKDYTTFDLINDLMEADLTYFDRGASEIQLLRPKDGSVMRMITAIVDKTAWRIEFASFLDNDSNTKADLTALLQKKKK